MIIRAVLTGSALGFGFWLILRGFFAPRPTLDDRVRSYGESSVLGAREENVSGAVEQFSLWLLKAVKGDSLADVIADVELTDASLAKHALEKLQAAFGVGVLTASAAFFLGFASSATALLFVFVMSAIAGYFVPDFELKKKAAERRAEFTVALTAFVTLASVSISGGGGLQTALRDAVSVGDSWPFRLLSQSLASSSLKNQSPWTGFDELGRRLNLAPLIEFAGALGLAGSGGAPVTETLAARAEAGRAKEFTDAKTEAEKKTASLGVPLGVMLLGLVGFMGYPALIGIIGG